MSTAYVTRTKAGKRTAHVGDCAAVTRCIAPIGTWISYVEMSTEDALQGIEKGTYSDCKACAKTPRGKAALAPKVEEAPEVKSTKVKVTVVTTDAGFNVIHAAGCKDVKKDAEKYGDASPWTFEVDSVLDLALTLWSDIAGDTTKVGSPEHRALAKEYLETDDRIMPCCALKLSALSPEAPAPVEAPKVELTIVNTQNGYSRIHAAGCADVARDVKKYRDPYPQTVSVSSPEELALELWSDVAGDNYEEGTAEHLAECVSNMDSVDVILPCAGMLYAKKAGPDTPRGLTGLTDRQIMRDLKLVKVTRAEETKVTVLDGKKTYERGSYAAVADGRGRYRLLQGVRAAGSIQFAGGTWRAEMDGWTARGRTVLESFDAIVQAG